MKTYHTRVAGPGTSFKTRRGPRTQKEKREAILPTIPARIEAVIGNDRRRYAPVFSVKVGDDEIRKPRDPRELPGRIVWEGLVRRGFETEDVLRQERKVLQRIQKAHRARRKTTTDH
jgi:hypothetical protein